MKYQPHHGPLSVMFSVRDDMLKLTLFEAEIAYEQSVA